MLTCSLEIKPSFTKMSSLLYFSSCFSQQKKRFLYFKCEDDILKKSANKIIETAKLVMIMKYDDFDLFS